MNFDLTDEQRLLVGTVRAFVERELFPHEEDVERAGSVDPALARSIRVAADRAGLRSMNMPTEFGGGGLSHLDMTLVERELGRASFVLHDLVPRPSRILLACTGEQIARYLLPAVAAERSECFALTEPGAGSDVMAIETRAEQTADGWRLTGQKHFISGGTEADFAIVFAVTSVDADGFKRVSAFLVDAGTPGFGAEPGPRIVSHRGYGHAILYFDGCEIPAAAMLGEEGEGYSLASTWLADSRLTVAAQCSGRARRVLDMAADWAATREQFGRAIGRFQGTGFKFADMWTELEAADLLTLRAAWLLDHERLTEADAAMAKLKASEVLGFIADEAVQVFGGLGLTEEMPIERFWRDARIERIWDGTSEIQRHIISRQLLRPRERRR